jgi:DNA polymerase-3 subunit epsilon
MNIRDHSNLNALDHIRPSGKARLFDYVALDLETTGLNPKTESIIWFGAIRIRRGNIVLGDIFNEIVRPTNIINPNSIQYHGIVPEMVSTARLLDDAFDDFIRYVGVDIIIAHHARFDMAFLNKLMIKKYNFPMQNLVLDTLLLSREILFPAHHVYPFGINLKSKHLSLHEITKHYGVDDMYYRHTAIGDALAAGLIFQRVLSKIERQGIDSLRTLINRGAV